MERLTFEGNFCDISRCEAAPGGSFCEDGACDAKKVWVRLREFEDIGYTPAALAKLVKFDEAMKRTGLTVGRIYDLIVADEAGRVVVLPCKIGSTVYLLRGEKVVECYAYRVQVTKGCLDVFVKNDNIDGIPRTTLEFGKTVFLTREEAEKALEARKDG